MIQITDPVLEALIAQSPALWDAWISAGGLRDNYRRFLLGQGQEPVTGEALTFLGGQLGSVTTEMQLAISRYPFAPVSRLVEAIDVASYQPADLSAIIATSHAEHVIVRLYLPQERPAQQHSLDQIASARANGCSVGGYCWVYPDLDPVQTVRNALSLAARATLALKVLWLDVETYMGQPAPGVAWLRAAADECARIGVRCGIYSGVWYVRSYMPDAAMLADLPLWTAQYDGVADPDQVTLYGGWTKAAGKQYRIDSIDHDVLRSEYT
jgi:hypothetical protein